MIKRHGGRFTGLTGENRALFHRCPCRLGKFCLPSSDQLQTVANVVTRRLRKRVAKPRFGGGVANDVDKHRPHHPQDSLLHRKRFEVFHDILFPLAWVHYIKHRARR